jgi:hypothetical protein
MSDAEVSTTMRTLADNVKTYEQVVEVCSLRSVMALLFDGKIIYQLLAYLMPHGGGLLHLGFGLFHQKEAVREATVDLFNQLRVYPVRSLYLDDIASLQCR